ncbi:MAG: nucleoside deaminase [Actinobacteria bacterium]|nr:nucleoside deaminase [Actinomycetota bacterium]
MLDELEPPMRRALELAWEAYRAGSFPVGSVITDPRGDIVVEGRNRAGEGEAPPGRMRNSAIAHAEVDALSQLPMGEYSQHTLYTSLEPCLLCRSAMVMTHIGTVHFLAADSLCEGLDRLPEINGHASRRHPTMAGPGHGVVAEFAGTLPMAVLLLFNRDGTTAAHYAQHAPSRVAAARRILDEDLWPPRRLSLEAAIDHLSPVLSG